LRRGLKTASNRHRGSTDRAGISHGAEVEEAVELMKRAPQLASQLNMIAFWVLGIGTRDVSTKIKLQFAQLTAFH